MNPSLASLPLNSCPSDNTLPLNSCPSDNTLPLNSRQSDNTLPLNSRQSDNTLPLTACPSDNTLPLTACPSDNTLPLTACPSEPSSSNDEEPVKIAPSTPLDPLAKKDLTIPKYHRRILVFDTETTRLMPKHKRGDPFPPDEAYPYVAQLSWILFNIATNQIEEVVNEYVQLPAKVEFDPESSRITGITRETVDAKGVPLAPLLLRFYAAYMKSDCIVAHNMNFDGDVMRKEYWRNRAALLAITRNQERVNLMQGLFTKKYNSAYCIDMFCTMMNTIDFCGIRFPDANPLTNVLASDMSSNPMLQPASLDALKPASNRKKFPRLNELYTKLFEMDPPGNLHNSIIDVLVCLRCFLKVRGATEMTEKYFQRLVGQYSSV